MLTEEILENKIIKQLILDLEKENHRINYEVIDRDKDEILEFLSLYKKCEENEVFEKCSQEEKGLSYGLIFQNNHFYLEKIRCNHWKFKNKNFHIKKNYYYSDFDIELFPYTASEIRDNPTNFVEIFSWDERIQDILLYTETQINDCRGIYLWGDIGIGKTTIMKLISNSAAKNNQKVIFISMTNLLNKVKQSFSNDFFTKGDKILIDNIKTVDFLFLDDVGGEKISNWSRDDFLFDLFNFRMENKKPTFFTSNFNQQQLIKNYRQPTLNPKEEWTRSKRFFDRLVTLASEIRLEGVNLREKQRKKSNFKT